MKGHTVVVQVLSEAVQLMTVVTLNAVLDLISEFRSKS